jgi:hypothetical protein
LVSGLVSLKSISSENLFQAFAAIETLEVMLDRSLPVIGGLKVAFNLVVID